VSETNGKPARSRRGRKPKRRQQDLWQEPRPLPEVEPIHRAPDPTALIRSLGEPPVRGGVSGHYLAAVAARAAALAAALAESAGLLADADVADVD
jgi:hypothetical protein